MMGAAVFLRDPIKKKDTCIGRIGQEIVVGTSGEADVRIKEIKCGGIHALLQRESDGHTFRLVDLGSPFGTFIKGKRIKEAELRFGDVFQIGRQQLYIRQVLAEDFFDMGLRESLDRMHTAQKNKPKPIRLVSESQLLEASLYWGDQLLDVRTFDPGCEITLGSQMGATFGVTLADPALQKTPYSVASYDKGELKLRLPEEATGLVWSGAEPVSIDTLRHRDASKNAFGKLDLTIRIGDRADLQFGELTLSFKFVTPAEKLKRSIVPAIDKTFSKVMSAIVFLYICTLSWMTIAPMPTEKETLQHIPKHLKRVVVDAGIDEALKRQQAAIGQLMPDLQGGRARGEEGKASGKKDLKKPEPQVNKNQSKTKATNKKDFKATPQNNPNIDFDAAFSSSPNKKAPTDVASIHGDPQEGNTAAAIANGNFARGSKGLGAGGGGRSVGIGQLTGNQTGGGMGAGDYGLSPSKGRDIRVGDLEEIVILGGLDPEIIAQYVRRYLAQIRNCYEQQLALNPNLKGKVTVKFVIGPDGTVQDAKVVETSLENPKTEACIEKRILDWKFPKPKGGSKVGVKYPFLLMSNTDK